MQRLPSSARDGWDAVTSVAFDQTPSNDLGKRLMLLRHKVAAHYDPKAIAAGFRHHFAVAQRDERAFVSRGATMRGTRYYFADAATTGYFETILGTATSDERLREVADLVGSVNRALMGFVDAFVQRRGYAYRAVSE